MEKRSINIFWVVQSLFSLTGYHIFLFTLYLKQNRHLQVQTQRVSLSLHNWCLLSTVSNPLPQFLARQGYQIVECWALLIHTDVLYFSHVVCTCCIEIVMEIMGTKLLTKGSAMLHDKAGVDGAWERVCWRGKRPLVVTHWTHSTTRVAIHCYLALRKVQRYLVIAHSSLSTSLLLVTIKVLQSHDSNQLPSSYLF